MGNDGGGAILQIISPSARTGFGVPSTGGGGTSTALTVASGACSMTVTSPISIQLVLALQGQHHVLVVALERVGRVLRLAVELEEGACVTRA